MARPLGRRTLCVIEALREQPQTARDLAHALGVPVPAVSVALRNLSRQQRIAVVGVAPRDGRQPVAVYACRDPRIVWLDSAPAWLR